MRKQILAALLLSLGLGSAWAEGNIVDNTNGQVRTIKAPRFARPLVEKWISEYAKVEPGILFTIAKGSQPKDDIDLNVVFDHQPAKETDTKDFSHSIIYFGEFAVLPITASGSKAAKVLEGKHLNSKKLKQLYFLNDDPEEEEKKAGQFEQLVVYSGRSVVRAVCSPPVSFA